MQNKINLLLIAAVGLFFALACGNSNQNTNLQTANSNATPKFVEAMATTIKADELTRAYDENEIAADAKYKGKPLAVSGKISNIAEVAGALTIQLEGHKESGINLLSVMCAFENSEKEQIAKLKKGQTVLLSGVGDGKTLGFYVGLKACKIN